MYQHYPKMYQPIQLGALALVSTFWLGATSAQEGASLEGTSRRVLAFTSSVPISQCSLADMKPVDGVQEVIAPVGAKIITIKSVAGKTAFYFLEWQGGVKSDKNKKYRGIPGIEGKADLFYWCVDNTYLTPHAEELKKLGELDIAVGALAVPVKLRPGWGSRSFEFTTDAVLSGAFDVKWRLSDRRDIFLDVLVFGGITPEVELTEKNSGVKELEKETAFSYGGGIGFSGPDIGIAVVIGWDLINDDKLKRWDFQNSPWFGISISTSFGLIAVGNSPQAQSE